jgi:hypothetical protein
MSFYTPTFANISSGWYRKTTEENYSIDRNSIDIIWNSDCDVILSKYIKEYGCFFQAFFQSIKKDIELSLNVSLSKYRYYEYYFLNRAFELGYFDYLSESYQDNKQKTFICECCNKTEYFDFLHPEVMCKIFPPRFCRECYYIVRNYLDYWNDEIINAIHAFMENIGKNRKCSICNKEYIIKKTELFENNLFTPFTHINIFASVCQKCLRKTFNVIDNTGDDKTKQYKLLLDLAKHINKIPTQDFYSLFYLFRDEENIITLVKILQKLWLPETFKAVDGSFFASLVYAGVLPEGTKRLKIGTMVLAQDGHLCYSIIEKQIDDFLFNNNINHKKETKYPNSDLRCDWEIVHNNRRYFVEYFGLMNIKEYARKAENKKLLAKENDIILIELYPDTKWENKIKEIFL